MTKVQIRFLSFKQRKWRWKWLPPPFTGRIVGIFTVMVRTGKAIDSIL